eukprot:TRINITY_DN31713_c0_g1_i1.p1 TRINITY_DN31713_c0_g1~~TRINITY_DN31713_c0_g1_i1.p1  ORF type:complete len:113 (-),score=19.84 TRINITY_DN31713_c0_g1_i1:114-452(-)
MAGLLRRGAARLDAVNVSHWRHRPSIMNLRCGRCRNKVSAHEGMQFFLRRHMPDASVAARTSLTHFTWGLKKQVGIYDPGRTSPPSRQVRDVLNGSGVGCPKCGAVEWKSEA